MGLSVERDQVVRIWVTNRKVKPTKLAGVLGSGWERKKRVKTGLLVFGLNNWKDEMAIYGCGDGRGGDANGRK